MKRICNSHVSSQLATDLSKRQVKARLASRLYMALDQFRLEMIKHRGAESYVSVLETEGKKTEGDEG